MTDTPINDEDTVEWPEFYTDPDTGEQHGWHDQVPSDGGYAVGAHPDGYTYRDLAYDQAGATGMEIDEYLDHLRFRDNPVWDEPGGISPSWVDDGDGYGE